MYINHTSSPNYPIIRDLTTTSPAIDLNYTPLHSAEAVICSIDRMVPVCDEVNLACSLGPSITTHVPNFRLPTAAIPNGFSVAG